MAEAEAALAAPDKPQALKLGQEAVKKGRSLLAERQKLIKIADHSEFGWGVVAEYTANELAADSDDEKAEKAAERKAAKRKRKRAEPPAKTGKTGGRFSAVQPALPLSSPAAYASKRPATAPALPRAVGPCFACGEVGHLRSYCPRLPSTATTDTRKWYPLHSGASQVAGPTTLGSRLEPVGRMPGRIGKVQIDRGEVELESITGYWETEDMETVGQSIPVCVKGRLSKSLQFWKEELGAPDFVVDTIETGYVLPLKSIPAPFSRRNQTSAMHNTGFVQQSLADLLASNCIREVPQEPYICSPLSVVESSGGKKRLVINLRHLNKFLWKQKFKYEDLRVAILLFENGDFLFSFDLKSGYHHVDIAEAHCKYLGFGWDGHLCVYSPPLRPFHGMLHVH